MNPLELLLVKKLSNNAIIPKKGSPGSVGYDLFSPLEAIIQPQSQCLIPTEKCWRCAFQSFKCFILTTNAGTNRPIPRNEESQMLIITSTMERDLSFEEEIKCLLYYLKVAAAILQIILLIFAFIMIIVCNLRNIVF